MSKTRTAILIIATLVAYAIHPILAGLFIGAAAIAIATDSNELRRRRHTRRSL